MGRETVVDKVESIKTDLWPEIDRKVDFIKKCAAEFGRSEHTVHNLWFARFWQIPIALVDDVEKFMKRYIDAQNREV